MNTLGLPTASSRSPASPMADLKGKKIGVPEGTSGDMILTLALAKAGLQIADVEVIQMDPVDHRLGVRLEADRRRRHLVSADRHHQEDGAGPGRAGQERRLLPGELLPVSLRRTQRSGRKDPDLVKRMIAVLKEANDYRAADVPRSVEITAKFLGVPADPLITESQNGQFLTSAELVAASKDGSVANWLKGLNEQFVAFGKLQNPLDPKDYYLSDLYAGG